MPESPDFDQIARRIAEWTCEPTDRTLNDQVVEVTEQLRLIWNARGAADIAMIEAEWRDGLAAAAIDRALRSLDR